MIARIVPLCFVVVPDSSMHAGVPACMQPCRCVCSHLSVWPFCLLLLRNLQSQLQHFAPCCSCPADRGPVGRPEPSGQPPCSSIPNEPHQDIPQHRQAGLPSSPAAFFSLHYCRGCACTLLQLLCTCFDAVPYAGLMKTRLAATVPCCRHFLALQT